jgi:hypothetical protein
MLVSPKEDREDLIESATAISTAITSTEQSNANTVAGRSSAHTDSQLSIRTSLALLKPIWLELTEENLVLHQALVSDGAISHETLSKIVEIHLQYQQQSAPLNPKADQKIQHCLTQNKPAKSSMATTHPGDQDMNIGSTSKPIPNGQNRDLALDFCAMRDVRTAFAEYPFDPLLPRCPPIGTAKAASLQHESDASSRSHKRQKLLSNINDDFRTFVVGIGQEGQRAGICDASQAWLDFCGLKKAEVLWKQPKELLQGPLTSPNHIQQMHEYFSKSADRVSSKEILVISDLVNYRVVGGRRVPFKCKLIVLPQEDNTFLASFNNTVDILSEAEA